MGHHQAGHGGKRTNNSRAHIMPLYGCSDNRSLRRLRNEVRRKVVLLRRSRSTGSVGGNVTKVESAVTSTARVDVTMEYDAFGNVTKTWDERHNWVATQYETRGLHPYIETNIEGHHGNAGRLLGGGSRRPCATRTVRSRATDTTSPVPQLLAAVRLRHRRAPVRKRTRSHGALQLPLRRHATN